MDKIISNSLERVFVPILVKMTHINYQEILRVPRDAEAMAILIIAVIYNGISKIIHLVRCWKQKKNKINKINFNNQPDK